MEPQIKLESRVVSCLGSLTVGFDGFRGFWIPPRQQLQAFSNEPFSFVSTKVMSHHMPPEGRFSKKAEIRRNQIKELEILFVLITLDIMLHLGFLPPKKNTSPWSMIKLNPNVNIQKLLHYLCLKTSTIFHQGTDEKQELRAEARMNRGFGVLHAIGLIDLPGSSRLYWHPFSVTKGWAFTMIRRYILLAY